MSLVNEMLNDLQKDQQKPVYIQGMVATDQKPTHLVNLFFVSLLLVVIVLIGYWLLFSDKTMTIQENSNSNSVLTAKLAPQEVIKTSVDASITSTGFAEESTSQPEPINSIINKTIIKTTEPKSTPTENHQTIKKPQVNHKEPAKMEEKIETISIKKISRKTLAEKSFSSIVNRWNQTNANSSFMELDTLLDGYPDVPSVWLNSLIFLRSDYPNLYKTLLEKALATKPKYDPFLYLSARDYFSSKNYILADQQMNKTNKTNWDNNNYRLAGLIAQKLHHHQQAISHYKEILSTSPYRGDINMAIGISYEAMENYKLAVAHFTVALSDSNLSQVQKQFIKQRLVANQG